MKVSWSNKFSMSYRFSVLWSKPLVKRNMKKSPKKAMFAQQIITGRRRQLAPNLRLSIDCYGFVCFIFANLFLFVVVVVVELQA